MTIDQSKFVIFLDLDGVLVPYDQMQKYHQDGHHYFSDSAIRALNSIIKYYDADLCMTSSWNSSFPEIKSYKKFLKSRGVKVNNLFTVLHYDRYNQVDNLINAYPDLKYLIIDDECFGYLQKSFSDQGSISYQRILSINRMRCLDHNDVWAATKQFTLNL